MKPVLPLVRSVSFAASVVASFFSLGLITPLAAQEADQENNPLHVKTTELNGVRAELSFQRGPEDNCATQPQIAITRQGRTVLNSSLKDDLGDVGLCWISNLRVQDLDRDQEPEVLLDLYSGGAHCCTTSVIYGYDAQQDAYTAIDHFWGNGGYRIADLNRDGQLEFDSRDDAFAYAFASYAGSQYPVQIWQYRQGEMIDTTRQHRDTAYSNAYRLWQDYTEIRAKAATLPEDDQYWAEEIERSTLAAYLADKHSLGEGEDGWRRVQAAYQRSDRREFFDNLRTFLQQVGYISDTYTKWVQFAPDSSEAYLLGRIDPQHTQQYLLNCGAGQTFSLEVRTGDVLITILDPNNNIIGTANSNQGTWTGQLPSTGDYTVKVTPRQGSSEYVLHINVL